MPTAFVAAVDVGATNVRLAIVDSAGAIRSRHEWPIAEKDPEPIVRKIAADVRELAASTRDVHQIEAVGLSFTGRVDTLKGRVTTLNPTAEWGWDDVPIPEIVAGEVRVPVNIENDANAAALGEGWVGSARGVSDYAFIAFGTAFGLGIVIDGRLHRGKRFMSGEMSMFPMIRSELQSENWDLCLALRAGGVAAATQATSLLGEGATAADLFNAARAGDDVAGAWVLEMQEYVAMAVAYTALVLDPDVIVFGGGVAFAQGEWLLQPIRELSSRFLLGRPDIRLSTLGPNAQLLGAARLALDSVQNSTQ